MIYVLITLFLVAIVSYICNYYNRKAIIISGFPGIGKSTLFKNCGDLKISDSDSSKFDKTNFPYNYISHIKDLMPYKDIILVSSHKIVRDALIREDIDHYVVFPSKDRKQEFLDNYKLRGNTQEFINLVDKNWDNWISEIEEERVKNKEIVYIELKGSEYLSDIISIIK